MNKNNRIFVPYFDSRQKSGAYRTVILLPVLVTYLLIRDKDILLFSYMQENILLFSRNFLFLWKQLSKEFTK